MSTECPGIWLQKKVHPVAEAIGPTCFVNFRLTRRTASTLFQADGTSLADTQARLHHAGSEWFRGQRNGVEAEQEDDEIQARQLNPQTNRQEEEATGNPVASYSFQSLLDGIGRDLLNGPTLNLLFCGGQ